MKLDKNSIHDVLRYWMTIEELTPFELRRDLLMAGLSDGVNNQPANIFIWDRLKQNAKKAFEIELDKITEKREISEYMKVFTVCVGVVEIDRYVRKVIEVLKKENSYNDVSELDMSFSESSTGGKMCLATFKINHFGKVVVESFMPSSALGWLAFYNSKKKSEDEDCPACSFVEEDILSHFVSLCREKLNYQDVSHRKNEETKELYKVEYTRSKNGLRQFRDLQHDGANKITVDFLDEVSRFVCDLAGIHSADSIWVIEQFQKTPHKVNDDFMNSPYIASLANMAKTVSEGDPDLLLSPVLKNFFLYSHGGQAKKDILRDPKSLYELADPKLFNLGRWPDALSKYLSVCQQLAVSKICQASPYMPIITVNGPPGTGKTTLLRDVLADVVVRRASVIASIADITKEEIFEMDYSGGSPVPLLKSEYTNDFPIVVVSNTNKAIENISKELPSQYSYEEPCDYFSSLAESVFGKDSNPWGFLSLPLGKSENWNRAYKAMFDRDKNRKMRLALIFEQEEKKLGEYKGVVKAWEEERENFHVLHQKVKDLLQEQCEIYRKDLDGASQGNSFIDKAVSVLNIRKDMDPEKLYFNFSKRENLDRHLDRLYSTDELDRNRTELFLSALKLHKYTILIHRHRFITAIEKSFLVMGKPGFDGDPMRYLGTFCFLCPLISSTLAASVARFSPYLKASLPWVLVDEASQVTPQSALPMMQKAKRFIVVGDPKQLQPVVTLPEVINALVIGEKTFLKEWSPFKFSLQTLCDATQDHGTWIGDNPDTRIWTGLPLRAQRRSYPPMFDISNAISYENQMVLGKERRDPKEVKALIPSFWWDIVPTSVSQTNAVREEVEAVGDVLKYLYLALAEENLTMNLERKKSVMIISPFRAVANAVQTYLKGQNVNNEFFKVARIGTTHVMQGQQADIVIFVLGSKQGEMGQRARIWATEPPNLINVAVSRAVETLIVIGNVAEWEGLGPMSEILYQLRHEGEGVITDLQSHFRNSFS